MLRLRTLFKTTLCLALAAAQISPALAQRASLPIVRDAEIEALVKRYSRPIIGAAGLNRSGIQIVLVNNKSFNAFVVGRRMFMHTGTLMEAESPNEVIGVVAHEMGHIAGGHQERLRDQLARAQTLAVIAAVLGAGAIAGGVASGNREIAGAGGGIVAGGGEAARRTVLAYQRGEEVAADRSAITYLNKTGQSARGMLKTFDRLANSLSLSGVRVDRYRVSHPLPRDRIANLRTLAEKSPHYTKLDSPQLQARHDMMRAKIAAYTAGPNAVRRMFRDRDSVALRYGEAINAHLRGSPADALRRIDQLIKILPKNPYFHELRGDVLVRARKPQQAVQAYKRAISHDPNDSSLIRVSLGQAYLAAGNPKQAVSVLERAVSKEPENAVAYRYLAQAYGQLGNVPQADLATAENHFYAGRFGSAKLFATRAQQKFKTGSPGWLRAQDIVNFKSPKPRRK